MRNDYGKILLAIAIAALAIGLLLAVDGLHALGSESCGAPGADPDCYPWGTEGPTVGEWAYESKTRYLFTAFLPAVVALAVLLTVVRRIVGKRALGRAGFLGLLLALTLPFLLPLIY